MVFPMNSAKNIIHPNVKCQHECMFYNQILLLVLGGGQNDNFAQLRNLVW